MPVSEIPISKGTFKTQNPRSLRNTEFAEDLINLILDQAGTNYDRPTLELLTMLDSIEPIGMYSFDNVVMVVTIDRRIFTVDTVGNVNNITGTSLPGEGRPVFADNGTTVFIAGGEAPLKWTPGGLTALLGGSPPDMTHIVYLDDYLIGNRRNQTERNKVIQFSDNGTTETWTGSNIFSHVADPDELQGLTVSQRELYAVGQRTIEVWQNIGTTPIPFVRAFIWEYGTGAPYSIHSKDNSVFILDQDRRILRFAGREFKRVSEGIEADIATYESVSDCVINSFTWDGSIHIFCLFPSAGKAWSLDLKNDQWTEWRGYDENGFARVRMNCLVYAKPDVFAGDFLTGKVWKFSRTEKTDAGGIFKRVRRFSNRDGGAGVRKRANLLRFNMKRNVASEFEGGVSETNPKFELRWRDDDKPFSEFRNISLGEIGEQKTYAEFRRLGVYRSRQYEFQFSDPSELSITSVETDEEVMVS